MGDNSTAFSLPQVWILICIINNLSNLPVFLFFPFFILENNWLCEVTLLELIGHCYRTFGFVSAVFLLKTIVTFFFKWFKPKPLCSSSWSILFCFILKKICEIFIDVNLLALRIRKQEFGLSIIPLLMLQLLWYHLQQFLQSDCSIFMVTVCICV